MFGLKQKSFFFLRAVSDIADYLLLIEETLSFVPAITGAHISSYVERVLIALPVEFGGLELQNLCEVANIELLNFTEVTRELYENFITRNKDCQIDSKKTETIKNELKTRKISN